MTDDLERRLQAIEGQPPSDEFRERLRARIVAETEGRDAAARADGVAVADEAPHTDAGELGGDVEPMPYTESWPSGGARSGRTAVRLIASAAAALAAIGIWAALALDGESGLVTVNPPTTGAIGAPDEEAAVGQPITGSTFFEFGTFRIDTLGTAFTFKIEETVGALRNDNGVVSITALTTENADDRTITFYRTGLLPDPAAPTARLDPTSGWPATDLGGWLDVVGDSVTATDPTDTLLGGLDAVSVELEFPCQEERRAECRAGKPQADPDLPMFTPGSRYRLWVVDQGAEDPIVVIVAIDDDDETEWFDRADAILSSLEFASIEPNPVRRAPAGPTDLAVFDRIRVELPDEIAVVEPHDGFARLLLPSLGGDVEFLTRPLDTDGAEVASTEQVLQLLRAEAVVVTELDAVDLGGFVAQVFEIDSGNFPNVVLKTRAEDLARDEFGWESPHTGHLWIVEHGDRGLLIVSTEALRPDSDPEALRAWTESLVASLEFRDR